MCQRIRGIALALPFQFKGRYLHHAGHGQRIRHFFYHFHPLFRAGAARRQILVGRNGRRDQNQFVQLQGGDGRLGCLKMPQVGRVEGSAVNTDIQGKHPFFIVFLSVQIVIF